MTSRDVQPWSIAGGRPHARSGDLLFISAQAPSDATLPILQQVDDVAARLESILADAGAGPDDVVKLGIFYLQNEVASEPELLERLRGRFAGRRVPVVSAIPLPHMPVEGLVQVEIIAIMPGSKRSAARRDVGMMPSGFSRAVRCDDLIFVSAQMSADHAGSSLFGGDIVQQARMTIANISSAIAEAGGDMQGTVKLNTYYVGSGTVADWSLAAQVRSDAFRKPGPGATGVPVVGPYPDGYLVRQEAIAVVGENGSPAPRETSWPEDVWDWPIPVSFQQGLKVNDLLVLGGQVSARDKGVPVHPDDLSAQSANVISIINRILDGFDRSVDDLGKVTVFYATEGDRQDLATVIEAISPFFANGLPAITFVPLARMGLEGLNVEIEGIGHV